MTTEESELPQVRKCATDQVHARLLREIPDYAARRAAVENAYFFAAELFDGVARTETTTIPVVVHIVGGPDGAGAVTDEQVRNQIDVLNADYGASNPDTTSVPEPLQALIADTRIRFALAVVDPNGRPSSGINRVVSGVETFSADYDAVKFSSTGGGADAWPRDRCPSTSGSAAWGAGCSAMRSSPADRPRPTAS